METKKGTTVKNSDNDFLLPLEGERFRIGYVDEVNGEGAEEIAGFTPTRRELIQLVKYWYGRYLDKDWFWFVSGQTGSTEIRLQPFAMRRIDRAEALIGEKAVNKAIKEVRDEFKATVNARYWDIFENGDSKQWEAVQNEVWQQVNEEAAMKATDRLEELEKESSGAFIALVLNGYSRDKDKVILVSPTNSELTACV